MSIMTAVGIGAVAGLVVSSWQGFKDPPWEGFFINKFIRSILIGGAAGSLFFFADAAGIYAIDNPGVLAFAVVAVERVVGEAYKGFFRKGAHAEYCKLLRRLGIPENVYLVKLLSGGGFILAAYWLFRLLSWWLAHMVARFGSLSLPGLLTGAAGGLLVAIGGALKDSQFEGFKPGKFIRSPIVGAISGLIFNHLSTTGFLVVLASIGGERVGVEFYKTFLKRHVRGIHVGKPIRYPAWLARRGLFALSFGLAVASCVALLFV